MGQDSQSVADKDGGGGWGVGLEGKGGEGGGQARSPLSAMVFLCRVPHIFPLLAVALVVWLVALVRFGAGGGGGALLAVVAALLVGARHPGLGRTHRDVTDDACFCCICLSNSLLYMDEAGRRRLTV